MARTRSGASARAVGGSRDSRKSSTWRNRCEVALLQIVDPAASIFDPVEPGFGSLKIAPGDTRTGWITFEVPAGTTLRTLQFVTNSGFGSETEWALR